MVTNTYLLSNIWDSSDSNDSCDSSDSSDSSNSRDQKTCVTKNIFYQKKILLIKKSQKTSIHKKNLNCD